MNKRKSNVPTVPTVPTEFDSLPTVPTVPTEFDSLFADKTEVEAKVKSYKQIIVCGKFKPTLLRYSVKDLKSQQISHKEGYEKVLLIDTPKGLLCFAEVSDLRYLQNMTAPRRYDSKKLYESLTMETFTIVELIAYLNLLHEKSIKFNAKSFDKLPAFNKEIPFFNLVNVTIL